MPEISDKLEEENKTDRENDENVEIEETEKNNTDKKEDGENKQKIEKKMEKADKALKTAAKAVAISRTGKTKVKDAATIRNEALTKLASAKSSGTILSGILSGVEISENIKEPELAVTGIVSFDGIKVVIPAKHMWAKLPVVQDESNSAAKRGRYFHLMNAMLGAEVEFLVVEISKENDVVFGSRLNALEIRKRTNYINNMRGKDKSRMEITKELGRNVESRVVAVAGSVVRLEIFGVETGVYAANACWRYTANLASVFYPGQRVYAKIKDISIDADKNVKVTASIKEAYENTLIRNIQYYPERSVQIGVVSGKTEKGYFVAVGDENNGIDVFCSRIMGQEIPQVGDTVSCMIGKVFQDNGNAVGKITRIIKRIQPLRY